MSGTPNWGNLVAKDRVKAVGIPWSPEEQEAIHTLHIPAVYVREGFLTLEAYQAEITKNDTPIFTKTKKEIEAIAEELGIESTPDAPKEALVEEIKKKTIKK